MKQVKVLSPGCKRCQTAEAMVRAEAARLTIAVTVEKGRIVTIDGDLQDDPAEILALVDLEIEKCARE